MARMGDRGVAGGYPVRTVWWALRSHRIDRRNFLFFMASLPLFGGTLRASASALTGGWMPAKVLLAGRPGASGTETAKHSA